MTKNVSTVDLEEIGLELDIIWDLVTLVSGYFDRAPSPGAPAEVCAPWVYNAKIYDSVITTIGGQLRDLHASIQATLEGGDEA